MNEFSEFLGPEPEWLTCPCGAQSARVPCWDCTLAAETKRERDVAWAEIPARFRWASLDAPELRVRCTPQDGLKNAARRLLGAPRGILVGPAGSGKTSFAVACLRSRLPHVAYVSAHELATARASSRLGEEPAVVLRAMRAKVLVLDDLGNEARTELSAVRDVVFHRHDHELVTWVTTGLTSEQIRKVYGDGVYRRLIEGAAVVLFGPKGVIA